jgi:hypothetical protein
MILPVTINNLLQPREPPQQLSGIFSESSERLRFGNAATDLARITTSFTPSALTPSIQMGYFTLAFLKVSVAVSICRNSSEFYVQADSQSPELARSVVQHFVALLV